MNSYLQRDPLQVQQAYINPLLAPLPQFSGAHVCVRGECIHMLVQFYVIHYQSHFVFGRLHNGQRWDQSIGGSSLSWGYGITNH